ncbi:hypothetical protein F5Y19DRAFT_474332 [Xylariaceae sp. FL1651]|nr:hypothetical protein F5Y19DRAFT_474332 [Xylariaceae sp. FL1651]
MTDQEIIGNWYQSASLGQPSVFEDAFNEAKSKFSFNLHENRTNTFINTKHSVEELQDIVAQSMSKYESCHRQAKSRKWLNIFSQRVLFYADVLDILVKHHPEYVLLVWGAMKILFIGIVNHEATVCKLAKKLSKIADTIPRVKLTSIL